MGIKLETQNAIVEKAKNKKDGCYRFKGVAYRVRDGGVTHVGSSGEILACHGQFNVIVGSYEWSINSDEAAQKLLRNF